MSDFPQGARTTVSTAEPARRTPPPYPTLPNPGVAANGALPCNEPLFRNGVLVGYCERWSKPRQSRWRRPRPAAHRGPHRIEWWTSATLHSGL